MVVTERQPPCYGEREDDERVCQGVTDDRQSVSGIQDSNSDAYRSTPNASRRCAYLTPQKPSAQKYSGMYSVTEPNSAIHIQRYSPPMRSPLN